MKAFHNIKNELITDTLGNKHWISPSVSVDAIVVMSNVILVVRRSVAMSNAGLWCLPCGFMDFNETPLDACIRELFEETGIDIREQEVVNTDYSRPHAQNGTALQFIFELPDFPEVDINTKECQDYKWVTLDELPNYDWAFGHDMLIENLMSYL